MHHYFVLLLLLASPATLACSLVTPNPVQLDPSYAQPDEVAPSKPKMKVAAIRRGHVGDSGDSCNDLGLIRLVTPATDEVEGLAYTFEVISGETEDVIFPSGPLQGFEDEDNKEMFYSFPWLDGASNQQEPIEIMVRITPYRRSGLAGEPLLLKVSDPGR